MSTAGKVLTVLIMLVMVVWLVVMSAVTQLNVNWEEKIGKQQTQLDKLQKDAETAAADFLSLTEQARLKQDETDRNLREILGRIATAERRQSDVVEKLTRVKTELAEYLAAVEQANTNKATREAEFAQGEADLAKKKDEIAKAKGLNSDLRDQLAKLQEEFKRLLAENAAQVEKAAREGGGGVSRPTSSRRTPPAS
jgi:chromosome segregation ATPase